MTEVVPIDDIVVDLAIYPRIAGIQEATVDKYVDALAAGDMLPPVVVERDTMRLLDGHHRHAARVHLGLADIGVEEHDIPANSTAKLYAAQLQSKHGLPLVEQDEKALAREMYEQGGEVTSVAVAKALHRSRRTVDGWVTDLAENRRVVEEHRRDVRRCLALLLRDLGWTQQRVADFFGVAQSLVAGFIKQGESAVIDESVLRDAVAAAPTDVANAVDALAQQWREDRIFSRWSQDERDLLKQLRSGETVVVNMRADAHASLWAWVEQAGLAVRIDRKSIWGNPFLLHDDGTREQVCLNFADFYWPYKPSLHSKVASLQGKALGCWCAPARCHGDFLADQASR